MKGSWIISRHFESIRCAMLVAVVVLGRHRRIQQAEMGVMPKPL
jgi:hypothetical protein